MLLKEQHRLGVARKIYGREGRDYSGNGKGKFHPRTGHEGPGREKS